MSVFNEFKSFRFLIKSCLWPAIVLDNIVDNHVSKIRNQIHWKKLGLADVELFHVYDPTALPKI